MMGGMEDPAAKRQRIDQGPEAQSLSSMMNMTGPGNFQASESVPPPADEASGGVPPSDLTFAYVSKSFPQKGFSLVVTDPNDESSTVYVHHTVADPNVLAKGQPVAFKVHISPKGSPQASAPVWRLAGLGKNEQGATITWGEYIGKVAALMPDGTGLVDCREIKARFGQQAFVNQQVAQWCALKMEDVIRFNVSMETGVPTIQAPLWKQCAKGGAVEASAGPGMGGDMSGMQGMPGPPPGMGGMGGGPPPPPTGMGGGPMGMGGPMAISDGSGQAVSSGSAGNSGPGWQDAPAPLYVGCVTKADAERQMSLFFCPDSGQAKPVVAPASVVDPTLLKENQFVAFPIQWNSKGEAIAAKPFWKLVGSTEWMRTLKFGDFMGVVSKMNSNGSGFVKSEAVTNAYGRDAYIHKSLKDTANLQEGDQLAFDVHLNPSGMPQMSEPLWKCISPIIEEPQFFGGKGGGGEGDEGWSTWLQSAFMMWMGMGGADGKGKGKGKDLKGP